MLGCEASQRLLCSADILVRAIKITGWADLYLIGCEHVPLQVCFLGVYVLSHFEIHCFEFILAYEQYYSIINEVHDSVFHILWFVMKGVEPAELQGSPGMHQEV